MRPEIEIVAEHLRRLDRHFGPSLPGLLRARSAECRQDTPDDPIYLISEEALLDRLQQILTVAERAFADPADRAAASLLLRDIPCEEIAGAFDGDITRVEAIALQLAQSLKNAGLTTPLEYLLDR